jgi:type IX secretion system PorP/SprF family membrane protein
MKKQLIVSLLGICSFSGLKAQQIPLYNQYYINPFVYNPAYTGLSGVSNAYFINRQQWQGFTNAPVTYALSFDTPIQRDKVGLGVVMSSDQSGYLTRTEVMGSLSYKAKLSDNHTVVFGLAGGLLSNQIDFTRLSVVDPTESTIYDLGSSSVAPNASFGAVYLYRNLEISAAVPQLLARRLTFVNAIDSRTYYTLVRHYLGSLKYTFHLNKEKGISAYPIVLMRAAESNVPVQTEVSAVLDWDKTGWAGVSYRSSSALAFNVGLKYKGLTIGYVYEIPTTSVSGYAGNSNEILVGYSFGKPRKTQDKLDVIIKKLDNIDRQTKEVKSRADSLETRLKTIEFEREEDLKRDLREGDVVRLKNLIFEYKSTRISPASFYILDELINVLDKNPSMQIAIYGHTDDVGSDEYNDKLSSDRAKAVYTYLVEGGINAGRLTYKGMGERKPVMKGTSETARSRNRRVEFEVISK